MSTATLNSTRIENFEIDVVTKAILFCYDLPFAENISDKIAIDLLKFSEEFEILDLKDKMEEFCIQCLSPLNACAFANASSSCKAKKLYQKCFDFLLKCMNEKTEVKDIQELNDSMQKELFVRAFKTS
uniref:Uncharacterized protein n=1 Tax=Panagrolaimus davidi TaxID=227884 RepID=A0A914PBB0_9BILA